MRHAQTDDRVLGKSVEQRVNSATGGSRNVDGAPEGGVARRHKMTMDAMMDGMYWCDELQAAQGLVDPSRGETHFRPDNEDNRPRSDRSYRTTWKPASDTLGGTVVKMPYLS